MFFLWLGGSELMGVGVDCGSIVGRLWVDSGSILGRFWVDCIVGRLFCGSIVMMWIESLVSSRASQKNIRIVIFKIIIIITV